MEMNTFAGPTVFNMHRIGAVVGVKASWKQPIWSVSLILKFTDSVLEYL